MRADEIREGALRRLVDKGILAREEGRFLWVFRSRRYPALDGKAEQEVKLRIMEVLFSDKIPDPRDVVIICLADACGMFEKLLGRPRASPCDWAHRTGAQAGLDWSRSDQGDLGH